MNGIIPRVFVACLVIAVGHALQCYKCDIGFWNLCATSETTCSEGELCYSGMGKAAGFIDVKMKGCLAQAECNKTEQVNFPPNKTNSIYTMTRMCCSTNLCNAAPTLPSTRLLPLGIATLSTLLMAMVLV